MKMVIGYAAIFIACVYVGCAVGFQLAEFLHTGELAKSAGELAYLTEMITFITSGLAGVFGIVIVAFCEACRNANTLRRSLVVAQITGKQRLESALNRQKVFAKGATQICSSEGHP